MNDNPRLTFDFDPHEPGSGCVCVHHRRPDLVSAMHAYMQPSPALLPILRVSVVETESSTGEELPDVAGRYQVLEGGLRFTPYFPFEPGGRYRATFDPRPLGGPGPSDRLVLEFSLPKEQTILPTEVTHIFPSSKLLPENLLRFYVCFSNAMQRGRAQAGISLLGPDGEPVPDALYRAPVELWDRSMRCLTVLLDPGRLKRGVGPNRELGPPLKSGQMYTLAVRPGMTDISGSQLPETVYKRFRVTDASRERIAIEQWKIIPPDTSSRQPLTLIFPGPLDWALLSHTITVTLPNGQTVDGQIAIDRCEKRWSFTPASPWAAGSYAVRVGSDLEDVCGNTVIAAFDRPLRSATDLAGEVKSRSIPFCPM
jgi:hypothetical protein